MRLYKRTYGLRQICNIAVYIVHSACTIHLLNLPEKTAKRDIIHGVKHLEEIAEDWLCARRTLSILSVLARKWKIDLPEEASTVFSRTDTKFGHFSTADVPSPKFELVVATPPSTSVPESLPAPVRPTPQAQTPLQQSIYSYLPDASSPTATLPPRAATLVAQNMQAARISNGVGSMNTPNQHLISSIPYGFSATTTPAMTPSNDLPRNNSASETSSNMGRQVSPNLFGGVEALVESQDWWLRDQANLYGNWMNFGTSAQDASGPSPTAGPNAGSNAGMNGAGGSGYYPGLNGSNGVNDDWSY